MVMTLLAKTRHIIVLLPLLPSGPGGVHKVQLRDNQQDHHYNAKYKDFVFLCKINLSYLAINATLNRTFTICKKQLTLIE